MKKISLILSLVLFAVSYSMGQSPLKADTVNDDVIIYKDPRLDLLIKKKTTVNEVTVKKAQRTAKGYRLLLINTNNRNEALEAKTKIYSNFPELKAYLWHQAPYYKVKAGNFIDKKEAEIYRKKLAAYFPKGVFLMNDTVEVKIEKETEED